MKTITAIDAKNKFGQLIEAAQRQPVTITKKGRASVVVMSIEDYERRRKHAWKNLVKAMTETGNYAASQGLTQERLARLLARES
jgi:prevent-host-death family protein